MDKSLSFYAFEMLYWCGIRDGKLPVLIPIVFDFKTETVTIPDWYGEKKITAEDRWVRAERWNYKAEKKDRGARQDQQCAKQELKMFMAK